MEIIPVLHVAEILQRGLFYHPILGYHHQISFIGFAVSDDGIHALFGGDLQEVVYWFALGGAGALRYFVNFGLEHTTAVGEEQNIVVCVGP